MIYPQFLILFIACFITVQAKNSDIVGTWTSKSNQVFTGPGFYDPVDELLIEPYLPGRSISFSDDGHYELAFYIVTPNAQDHTCPTAVLQWEHGTYTTDDSEGTITLNSIEVDGRQLLSEPCSDGGTSTYSRYSSNTSFSEWYVRVDGYNGKYKLTLFDYYGNPWPALWLAYRPALMLPTVTLNPTASGDATGDATADSTATASAKRKVKRSLENRLRTNAVIVNDDYSSLWYMGVGILSLGALSYCFV